MLVLSRRVGERIVINENIVVTVVRVDGGRVRLGIEAPPEVSIIRQELARSPESAHPSKAAHSASDGRLADISRSSEISATGLIAPLPHVAAPGAFPLS